MNRLPFVTLAIAAVALAAHASPVLAAWLQYDRVALAGGEWWRGFTGHLAHFGANHLAWDLGVFMVLGWTCERESRGRCVLALASSAVVISAALWIVQPHFVIYRGLSGLDCALFGLLAGLLLQNVKRIARVVGLLALAAVGAKCVFEIATVSTVFARGGDYTPVPLAHLVGLLCGLLAAAPRLPAIIFPRNATD